MDINPEAVVALIDADSTNITEIKDVLLVDITEPAPEWGLGVKPIRVLIFQHVHISTKHLYMQAHIIPPRVSKMIISALNQPFG